MMQRVPKVHNTTADSIYRQKIKIFDKFEEMKKLSE